MIFSAGVAVLTNAGAIERLMKKARLELKKGHPQGAAEKFLRAYELNPKNQKPLVHYATVALQYGNPAEALKAGLAVIQTEPNNREAIKLSSEAAKKLRNWNALLKVSEHWCQVYPNDEDAIRSLAFAYFELGSSEKACDTYRALLEANPNSAEHYSMYARLCLTVFDYKGVEEALEKAHGLAPPTAESLYALARVKMFLGAFEEAETLCVEAMGENPQFGLSFVQYVSLRSGKVDTDVADQVANLAASNAQAPEHRASLSFACGDVHHAKKDFTKAMMAFDAGNNICEDLFVKEGTAYNPKNFERQREREQRLFREMPMDQNFEPGPARPLFVVGMPRSGTTLIESILAAHDEVYGAGELGQMPAIHNNALRWSEANGDAPLAKLPQSQMQSWRDQYFENYPEIGSARYVVDKQPLNFRTVGLIKVLFPEAAIIHIRRNPIDTGFSIYRNDFGKSWPYATDQKNIAHFYGEYARIAASWDELLGDAFPLFQYEELIADFEPNARRLLQHCDLDWRDECLEFHRVKRAVATFSTTQVRQPIRKKPTSAEAQYGDLLQPLKDGLIQTGVDIETGALL